MQRNAFRIEPLYTAAGIAAGNTLGPLFGAYLLRRVVRIYLAATTTLGLQPVTELATQLSGMLAIEPANPTRFQLRFPTRGTQELESLTTGIIQ